MGDLPPDLDRLGHALTHATACDVKRRNQRAERRRRRGQDFKYNDACIERHPAPQAAR